MFSFLAQLILFYLAVIITLFLPGWFLLRALPKKTRLFSRLEMFVLSLGFSLAITDAILLLLGALQIAITRWSILGSIAIFCAVTGFIAYRTRLRKPHPELPIGLFSRKQFFLIVLLMGLSLFIRTAYLQNNMVPSATDLGHHMYWTNVIVTKGIIPNYDKKDVAVGTDGNYSISAPQNISDFIIGEHLPFAAIALVSGISVISWFPIVTLLLIDMLTVLAIFILTLRLFEHSPQGKNIALAALFFIGPVFALMPPQAKYVSGGVIGNIIGNLLLPLALYCFLRAFKEKSSLLATLGIAFSMALFYTHHLTGFLFLFLAALSLLIIVVFYIRDIKTIVTDWSKLFFSLPVLSFLAFAVLFLFFVYTPTYLTNHAVDTVVGGPTKIEHTGLTPAQFKSAIGEPRVALTLAGIVFLLAIAYTKRKKVLTAKNKWLRALEFVLPKFPPGSDKQPAYHVIFLFSWSAVISIISLYPAWIKLDIPSGRVANYGVYPFVIIAAAVFVKTFSPHKTEQGKMIFFLKSSLLFSTFALLFSFMVASGFFDNQQNMPTATTPGAIVQTYASADYLSHKVSQSDVVINDHQNTVADTWVKIFFMRNYTYPLYRATNDRYENGIDRQEFCTLWMISTPDTPDSQKCFSQLGVDFTMVSAKDDAAQFQRSPSFWQVYANNELNIYYRPQ